MGEVEQFFKCPYCLEKISMLLDVSVDGEQSYVEDCEVCCQPIQLTFLAREQAVAHFSAHAS